MDDTESSLPARATEGRRRLAGRRYYAGRARKTLVALTQRWRLLDGAWRYGLAGAAIGAAVLFRWALTPILEDRAQFVVLALAVAATTWYAGLWPGVVATLLGAFMAITVLRSPALDLNGPGAPDLIATGVYLFAALAIVRIANQAHRRGQALEKQNAQLRELLAENRQLLALRDGFSGMLGHELRTPLTVVLGNAQLLQRWARELNDPRIGAAAEDISAETTRLSRLVEDILVVSRGDRAFRVDREPVLLQRLVPKVVEDARGRYPGLHVRIDMPPRLPAVAGDPTLIEQLLFNLLSNAAKYAGSPATADVIVRQMPGEVAIEVCDTGPGFPPDTLDRIFEAFYRAPSTASVAKGAGVGLYVVRKLVEAMGGSVSAANRAGGGARVTVTLLVFDED